MRAAPTTTVVLTPVADAYVRSSSPGTNYGTESLLNVDRSIDSTYLRFDLSSIPAGAVVESVTLRAYAESGYAHGGDGNVYTHFVADDAWGETTITHSNRPATEGEHLGFWWLWFDFGTPPQEGRNDSAALRAAVQREAQGDRRISLRLSSPGYLTRYSSREHATASQRPQLIVTYRTPTVTTLNPVADAYVRSSSPATNFGSSSTLSVDPSIDETYLRFDLSSIPEDAIITGVRLRMHAFTGFAYGGDGNVYTHFVSDDAWTESGINYTNRPPAAPESLGFWWLWYDGSPSTQIGENGAEALRAVVEREAAGDRRVSLRLHSPGYFTQYRSREHGVESERPQLVVTWVRANVARFYADADAHVRSGFPTTNYGREPTLSVERSEAMTYVRFDPSSLPAGSRVRRVTLRATAFTGFAFGGDGNVYTHEVLAS
jgi:hypothetical protein